MTSDIAEQQAIALKIAAMRGQGDMMITRS
jgi:hypothetical protein